MSYITMKFETKQSKVIASRQTDTRDHSTSSTGQQDSSSKAQQDKPPGIPVPGEERLHIVAAPPLEAVAAPDSNLHRSRDKHTCFGSSFSACR